MLNMAAVRTLVLNDLLCFLSSRYGKWELRPIKTVLLSFYSSEDISAAKELFFVHASKLPNADNLLKNRGRRDSDKRSSLELDDIFAALSTLDENRLMDYLPTFVSGEPMNLPTVNLGEGDLKAIMCRMDKMESLISHLQNTVNKMAADAAIRPVTATVQSSLGNSTVTCHHDPARLPAQPATHSRDQRSSVNEHCLLSGDMTSERSIRWEDDFVSEESTADGEWETETREMRRRRKRRRRRSQLMGGSVDIDNHESSDTAVKSAAACDRQSDNVNDQQSQRTVSNTNSSNNRREYVAVAATPVASSTSTTIENQRRNNPANQLSTKKKAQPMLIGKKQFSAGDHSSQHGPSNIMAAKPYVGKAVFCIDNVITSATETDIERHIKRMGVTVLSCHAVQPRRSRWQRLRGIVPADRSTFRVCIPREQSHKLLVADAWPANITITAWRFTEKKDTTTAAENASNQLPSSGRQPRESTSGGSHGTSTTTDRSTDHHRAAAAAAAGSDVVGDGNDNILLQAATASLASPSRVMSDVSERDFVSSLSNNDDGSENMDETIIVSYDGFESTKSN